MVPLGLGVLVLAILELVASGYWVPVYFRVGIPLFRQTCAYFQEPAQGLYPTALTQQFKRSLLPSLVFQSLAPGEIAFREQIFQFSLISYTPVMHGIIRVDQARRVVTVTGYADWYALLFFGWAFAEGPLRAARLRNGVLEAVALLAIFGGCYGIQALQHNAVFKHVREHFQGY